MVISKRRFALFTLLFTLWLTAYGGRAQEATTDLARFEQAGMIAEAELDAAIAAGEIGTRAEEAIVILVFDHDGNLFDAETYNQLIDEGTSEQATSETIYTDFTTYKKVMQEKASLGLKHQALEDIDLKYVFAVPGFSAFATANDGEAPPSREEQEMDQVLYLYDAYSTSYYTEEDVYREIEEQLRENPDPLPEPPMTPDAVDDSPPPDSE